MKPNSIIRFVGMLVCAGVLHVSTASAATETTLYSFQGDSDGAMPQAGLINVEGTLYGTTTSGGTADCGKHHDGYCGTVFSITTSGTENVLHAFKSTSSHDGADPAANLVNVGGTLYGTTRLGGKACGPYGDTCGAVFSITTSGIEKVLHSFNTYPDGFIPLAGLIAVKGTLYGTTTFGGTGCIAEENCGTVFSITPDGTEEVVYSFQGGSDGQNPQANLIDLKGTLYGTTSAGGGTGCGGNGCGTVFSITPGGAETVLYSFQGGSDGNSPVAALTRVKGTLYGTTAAGGGTGCGGNGCGTVFSITPGGTEKVLYSFKGGRDGDSPVAGLIGVKGTLYGTTAAGGGTDCNGGDGCGTLFKVNPKTGAEKIVHAFQNNGTDGIGPDAGLIDVNGTLYGTTYQGGTFGYGTVLSITP